VALDSRVSEKDKKLDLAATVPFWCSLRFLASKRAQKKKDPLTRYSVERASETLTILPAKSCARAYVPLYQSEPDETTTRICRSKKHD